MVLTRFKPVTQHDSFTARPRGLKDVKGLVYTIGGYITRRISASKRDHPMIQWSHRRLQFREIGLTRPMCPDILLSHFPEVIHALLRPSGCQVWVSDPHSIRRRQVPSAHMMVLLSTASCQLPVAGMKGKYIHLYYIYSHPRLLQPAVART